MQYNCGYSTALTQPEDLSPIPTTPAVVQCTMSCTGTHLSCGQCGEVDVSPLLLNSLAMHASYTMSVIEGVLDLALWAMRR